MRFKKGTKVEVLTQKEVPSGSWHCAEIIAANGRSYTVRYDGDIELFGKAKVERVSRKVIRPSPPPVDVLENWVAGDVVEVFHNFSWKMATILKVSGRNHILVRLLGLAVEIRASKYDVRARLCWQDGEWIVIGKASLKCEDLRFRIASSRNDNNQLQRVDTFVSGDIKGFHVSTKNSNIVQDIQAMPSATLKRKLSHCHSQIEVYAGPSKRNRISKRDSKHNQFSVIQRTQLPEKVKNVASLREVLHEKGMRRTSHYKTNDYPRKLISERENTDGAAGYSRSISVETNDDGSVSSSVASCSVYKNSSYTLNHASTAGQFQDSDSECSDAESFCHLGFKEGNFPLPEKEELTEKIHRLELHAYRCTIGALYASGSLSWEQELLLTNLRYSLHISNDEHLMEIRNLVSSSSCIPSS